MTAQIISELLTGGTHAFKGTSKLFPTKFYPSFKVNQIPHPPTQSLAHSPSSNSSSSWEVPAVCSTEKTLSRSFWHDAYLTFLHYLLSDLPRFLDLKDHNLELFFFSRILEMLFNRGRRNEFLGFVVKWIQILDLKPSLTANAFDGVFLGSLLSL